MSEWKLIPIERKTTLDSNYVVAQCPKCEEYLRQYVDGCYGFDDEHRTRIFGAHIIGGTTDSRLETIMTYAKRITLPSYCSMCGTRLHSANNESEEEE